ncbi:hypothetical protein [Weissella cibaria]|uniref:hypothetical protein n=1 Tax=Weissella cibaria TaxID=137591 RepID=UPI0011975457|nr:hypothetical protein [Weissella cibaria]MBU7560985.1 hypothetical protein [Weissella cibaria]MCS8561299.1 hypothetical protein [Weissella cibaria]MCS8566022.1 hypothetical protein [Weissella cibaria]MCS8576960.1 hypothetical protein [Weissella cibaria]MCT0019956.1 hypothetical protein [Weissella cibaria]
MTDMTKLARLFQWALVPVMVVLLILEIVHGSTSWYGVAFQLILAVAFTVMGRSSNIRIYWLVAFLALVTAVVNMVHLI